MTQEKITRLKYKVSGNSTIEYNGEVVFPINGVLAKTLKRDDDIKVVLLKKDGIHGNGDINVGEYMKELNTINQGIGAQIDYKVLSIPHDESRQIQEKLFKDMINEIGEGVQVYSDITYGPKSLPVIAFSAFNFAEKFLKADIKHIVYGKVDYDDKGNQINPELFDMTALFYLNSIASTMECKSASEAKKLLDTILSE
jgi:hypothetical protein